MKASVGSRVAAKGIDLFLVVVLGALLPRLLGPLLGFAYSLISDGMFKGAQRGQSVGKWLVGLQVRSVVRGAPCDMRESIIRNAPVGLAVFFAMVPLWGWFLLVIVGIPLLILEGYLMSKVDSRERLGDAMANTQVVYLRATQEKGGA